MFHGIPRNEEKAEAIDAGTFERQVVFLKKHFTPVSPEEIDEKRGRFDSHRVLVTFDDGFRNNFEVAAPILRKHRVPALFFISSRHCEAGRFLWFSYLWCLERAFKGNGFGFRGEFMDMSSIARAATMHRLRETLLSLTPHPRAMYEAIRDELPRLEHFADNTAVADRYAGMKAEQVRELSADPLFTVGVHTVDHPFLTRCEPEEAVLQVTENKAWLERVTGRQCQWIAYPGGDYDLRSIEICRQAGLRGGFAVEPSLNVAAEWERPRVGIYAPSLGVLAIKAILGRGLPQT